MGKDRNTMAKREREASKRRKAEDKRVKRNQRKTESNDPNFQTTSGEDRILGIFSKYLMPAGQMLCFSTQDTASLQSSLDSMVAHGFLQEEGREGGYSMTESGYALMKSFEQSGSSDGAGPGEAGSEAT